MKHRWLAILILASLLLNSGTALAHETATPLAAILPWTVRIAALEPAFIDELAKDTWTYLHSDWATDNHLPWSWRSDAITGGDYANPAEIGFYALSWLAAYNMQQSWSPNWATTESEINSILDRLHGWQTGSQLEQPHGPNAYNNSVFYQWYWISSSPPVVGSNSGDNHLVPSVDNAWLAASLITIRGYAEAKNYPVLAQKANTILNDMDFTIWYHYDTHRFSWGTIENPQGGPQADYYSNENRIINFVARALGQLSAEEFQLSLDALEKPLGVYDGLTVESVSWDGSYFTYAGPALFIRELDTPYGWNTIILATQAQINYARSQNYSAWGLSDSFDVGNGNYMQQGSLPVAMPDSPESRLGLITPHASALALITPLESQAIANLESISSTFTCAYDPSYGFRDSIMTKSDAVDYGECSARFSALAQEWIFLSMVNHDSGMIWDYFYRDAGVSTTHSEMYDPTWTLVWNDEFNSVGGVDTTKWDYDTDTGYPGGPSNWGTGEVEEMTNSTNNVFQSDGNLNIRALHTGMNPLTNWTSGRIETVRTDFQPSPNGIMAVEARIQLPQVNSTNGLGYWPAFWMLGAPYRGNYLNWPSIGEIDIMENVNGLNKAWWAFHCGTNPGGPCNEPIGLGGSKDGFNPSLQSAFHTYRMEFDKSKSPQEIRWYIDGIQMCWLVNSIQTCSVTSNQVNPATWNNATNHGFFILLNLAIGGDFPNGVYGNTTPTSSTISGGTMLVDYVRVYYLGIPIVHSILRTSHTPTNASSVNFTVTFSEPVTGVDTDGPQFDDFFITTSSGISGASITNVSGSGATYTVTVNTGTGSGTIRLDVPVSATITDLAGTPLSGLPYTSGEVYTIKTAVETYIGGSLQGNYLLAPGESTRVNYAGLDSGPVKVVNTDGIPIIAAIRDAWAVNGITTSFSQLMGLPLEQLSNKYVFPGYNNVTLNEQLRIANVDTVQSTVTVTIGGVLRGTYTLYPPGSPLGVSAVRVNYPGLDSGPVVIEGTAGVDIISAIREAWAVNGVTTSFVQLMGLPAGQLSNKYVFPAYNNVTLNEQLRIANVDAVQSTVTVTIGGALRGTYTLYPPGSPLGPSAVRVNYPDLDSGPVIVEGTAGVDIISAIRDAWAVNGVTTSFSQLMGMPAEQLSNKYLFPAYNNVTLNEQLRISNVDTVQSTVTVTIGGVERGTYTLYPPGSPLGASAVRINYPGLDSGPVVVEGTAGVEIISAIREAWAANGVTKSFVQLMGLPAGQLSTTFLFPAYNNVTLNEQLRIGMP